MGRYMFERVSSPGLGAGSTVFNMGLWGVAGGYHLKLRRLLLGTENPTTPSQITLGLFRSTNRGSGYNGANAFSTEDSASPSGTPSSAQIDFTGWTVQPTVGAVPIVRRSFDVFSESEWVFEGQDELDSGAGGTTAAVNGLALQVLDSGIPGGVSLVWSVVWEE